MVNGKSMAVCSGLVRVVTMPAMGVTVTMSVTSMSMTMMRINNNSLSMAETAPTTIMTMYIG